VEKDLEVRDWVVKEEKGGWVEKEMIRYYYYPNS
jgi:hypothetical protein